MSEDLEAQALLSSDAEAPSTPKSLLVPVLGVIVFVVFVAGIVVAATLANKYAPSPHVIVQYAACRAGTAVCPNGLVITCPMGANDVPCVQSSSSSGSASTAGAASSSSAGGASGGTGTGG